MTAKKQQAEEMNLASNEQEILPTQEEVNLASNQEEILPTTEEIQTTTTTGLSDYYSEEEFYEVFKDVFQFGADTFDCQSLAIQGDEELGARATSNLIYKQAEKYKFLNWIIERGNGRFGEAVLVISFMIKKVNNVAKEKKISNVWGKIWQKLTKFSLRKKTVKESASSERPVAEKQAKPEDYLKPADVS